MSRDSSVYFPMHPAAVVNIAILQIRGSRFIFISFHWSQACLVLLSSLLVFAVDFDRSNLLAVMDFSKTFYLMMA